MTTVLLPRCIVDGQHSRRHPSQGRSTKRYSIPFYSKEEEVEDDRSRPVRLLLFKHIGVSLQIPQFSGVSYSNAQETHPFSSEDNVLPSTKTWRRGIGNHWCWSSCKLEIECKVPDKVIDELCWFCKIVPTSYTRRMSLTSSADMIEGANSFRCSVFSSYCWYRFIFTKACL